jgi:hypothetical protein
MNLTATADFTIEEWNMVLQSPFQIGFYIIFSDPNFMGMFSEFKALLTAILKQPVQGSARELISHLVADIGEKSENPGEIPGNVPLPKGDPEDEMKKMIQGKEDVVILLETKTSAEEAAGGKVWL